MTKLQQTWLIDLVGMNVIATIVRRRTLSQKTAFFSNLLSSYCLSVLQLQDSSKHETLSQCWANAGPPSSTLAQNWPNIGTTSHVCWYITSLEALDCSVSITLWQESIHILYRFVWRWHHRMHTAVIVPGATVLESRPAYWVSRHRQKHQRSLADSAI